MDTSRFEYHLPERSIAQVPAARREDSRLLVVRRESRSHSHHHFSEIGEILPSQTDVYRNNARVLPARLLAQKSSGGRVECLLLRPSESTPMEWWCLLRPAKRLRPGTVFGVEGLFSATVLESFHGMERLIRFHLPEGMSVADLAVQAGQMPLPPYIRRSGRISTVEDRERYQTVYADSNRAVAAAAPTAGLHFSDEILRQLEERGLVFHDLTLHVGAATFQPIETDTVETHPMHEEVFEIPGASRQTLAKDSRLRLAVGTTSMRAMEAYARSVPDWKAVNSSVETYFGSTRLYIYPPAGFHLTQALLTNFHQPRSTLLCLVSAFLTPDSTEGVDWLLELYQEALDRGYRFLSYGDAMLIL